MADREPDTADARHPSLLDVVSAAALGEQKAGNLLFAELLRFVKFAERQRMPAVSRAAIMLWRAGKSAPSRVNALEFLSSYIHWAKSRLDPMKLDLARLAAFDEANSAIVEVLSSRIVPQIKYETGDRLEVLDTAVVLAMQTIVSRSASNTHAEPDFFFRGARRDVQSDESYYLAFRYSTTLGSVVKSLVIIAKPKHEGKRTFVFNEFMGGGQDSSNIDHLYRESEGIIVKSEKSFYFSGFVFNVPVDKKLDPDLYAVARRSARLQPDGLVLSAFEYDDVKLSPGIFGGLIMSVADVSQPVIARTAFLHVGVRSLLNLRLTDDTILPDVVSQASVGNEIKIAVEKIIALGGKRFGQTIQHIIKSDQEVSGYQELQKKIIDMIGNLPAWQSKSESGVPHAEGRGAIETVGGGRPRN